MAIKSFKDLEKQLNKLIKDKLQTSNKVKDVVIDEFRENIEREVYDAYTPRKYKRKRDDGGLTDRSNFEVEKTEDGVAIYSTREATDRYGNDVYAVEILEGDKEWRISDKWGYGFEKKRPFTERTREELKQNGKVTKALKDELKESGFKVE